MANMAGRDYFHPLSGTLSTRPDGGKPSIALDKHHAVWHCFALISGIEVIMRNSFYAIVAAAFSAVLLSGSAAHAGPYPFGDEPYTLNWDYYPQIQSGCWKWNWQQYQWNDTCPVYINPKAYMYHPRGGAVLRSRG